MTRNFLTLRDLSAQEITAILRRGSALKSGKERSDCPLIGKSIALIFEKASTRTRLSFHAGIYQLGAQPIYINSSELQLGRGETIEDTAKVLSRYVHGIVMRTFDHEIIKKFAEHTTIPVINGLTDLHHPCQALADLMTIKEKKGRIKDIRLAYIGDGNNVANSLIEAASLTGLDLILACPPEYIPDKKVYETARSEGARVDILADPEMAVQGADVIYTDVWVSMGQEKELEKKKQIFNSYQINRKLLSLAKSDAIVMHCLPAHRGEEITNEVIDSSQSVVFDQAENRLHVQKALIELLIK